MSERPPPRLLRPHVRCPKCRAYPAIRIPEAERDAACALPPDALKQTYQCRRCGEVYEIPASAFCRAS